MEKIMVDFLRDTGVQLHYVVSDRSSTFLNCHTHGLNKMGINEIVIEEDYPVNEMYQIISKVAFDIFALHIRGLDVKDGTYDIDGVDRFTKYDITVGTYDRQSHGNTLFTKIKPIK